jgi:hypothetical protein
MKNGSGGFFASQLTSFLGGFWTKKIIVNKTSKEFRMDIQKRLDNISARNLKKKHKKHSNYPIEKKIEVITQWLVLGNLKQVSALTGVSYDLIRHWRGEQWWPELEAEIRQAQNIEMDTKLSKIVEKSLAAVDDRVENGDFIYDQKSGKVVRKPVALRDVHRVAVDLIDRQEVLRKGQKDRGEVSKVSVDEHLKMLANQMAQWFEPKKAPVVLEEVEDAIYEEREAGLQTGTRMGTQEEAGEGDPEGSEKRGAF